MRVSRTEEKVFAFPAAVVSESAADSDAFTDRT